MLAVVPIRNLGFFTGWADELFAARPDQFRKCLRELASRSPEDAAFVGGVYRRWPHRLDVETLRLLFAALDSLLGRPDTGDAAYPLLDLLGHVCTTDTLAECRSLAGGGLEAKLVESATAWFDDHERSHELKLDPLRKLLLRIGGNGLTRLINAELKHPRHGVRLRGIGQAWLRPDEETVRLLAEVTESEETFEDSRPPTRVLQGEAVEQLAALGEDRHLIRAILRHGADVHDVRGLREDHGPVSDADLAPALEAIRDPASPLRHHAFFAVAVSGRRDLVPEVMSALETTELGSESRTAALWALYGLGADDAAATDTFARHLPHAGHRFVALCGLFQIDGPGARRVLLEEMRRSDPDAPGGPDGWLPAALSRHPDTREEALRFVWRSHRGKTAFQMMFRNSDLIELLGDVSDPEAAEYLLKESLSPGSGVNIVGRRRGVIRALAKVDRDAAFEAAGAALKSARHDRHLYPEVVVESDAGRGVPFLCRHLPAEANAFVRRRLCIALRHAGRPDLVRLEVENLLQGAARERIAAAEIIRWTGASPAGRRIEDLLAEERIADVWGELAAAAAFHEAEARARSLLEELAAATGPDRWRLVDALFDLVPPECLGREPDPLWIGRHFDSFPPVLQQAVNVRYRAEVERVERDLKGRELD